MMHRIADAVLARGNTWLVWVPMGVKMSGAVVGNPGLRYGHWESRLASSPWWRRA